MKDILEKLYQSQTLSATEAKKVLTGIATGSYNPAQIASFISVYLMRPVSVNELAGFRDAMMELCTKISFENNHITDIVGTGGDGKNTFNISTLSCFVVAAAGIKVAKHGNYGVSSLSGSSNVLEAIGYKFTINPSVLQNQLGRANLCFLHAPMFHPAMKTVASIRKDLSVRTFFNVLGPLVNPCNPTYRILGTSNPEIARTYNYLLQPEYGNYIILHSYDGYDEISLTGPFKMISRNFEKEEFPEPLVHPAHLSGGKNQQEATRIFMQILSGKGTYEQNMVVAYNAAPALILSDKNLSFPDAVKISVELLQSGKAYNIYKKLMEI